MAKRDHRGRYLVGETGNAGGRSKAHHEVLALAREHGVEAVNALIHLMRNAEDEKVRLTASEARLSRGFGKPISPRDITIDGQITHQLSLGEQYLAAAKEISASMDRRDQQRELERQQTIEHQPEPGKRTVMLNGETITVDDTEVEAPAEPVEPTTAEPQPIDLVNGMLGEE